MGLRFVFGCLPALVIYTDHLPQPWQGGITQGPVIRLRPRYRADAGLLAHELTHVRQWYATLGPHSLLYLVSRRYRLWAEVRAYRIQACHYPDDRRPLFARFIAANYGLNVTVDAALEALRK